LNGGIFGFPCWKRGTKLNEIFKGSKNIILRDEFIRKKNAYFIKNFKMFGGYLMPTSIRNSASECDNFVVSDSMSNDVVVVDNSFTCTTMNYIKVHNLS
jgi:hypothetical protein